MAPVTTQHTFSLIYCLSHKRACVVRAGILSLLCTAVSPVSRTALTHRRYLFVNEWVVSVVLEISGVQPYER